MPEAFHFQQPAWFLALLPLVLLVWWLHSSASQDSPWHRICDARLLPFLMINGQGRRDRLPLWLLATGWLVAILALADPVWQKRPQPVFRSEAARVVVLDLSRSMAAPDLAPSRLERARYKVEDVLRQSQDGQVGLVVFAGDAFVVSPLTNDSRTITEMLKVLEPGLMPVQGSRADLGLRKAAELLAQAGVGRGQVLLIADGFEGQQTLDAARDLLRQGYTVSVLGVGTRQGAPLSNGKGGYVHDATGAIVVPRLDVSSLRALAEAGGGHYATITGNDTDLDGLLTPLKPNLTSRVRQTGLKTDAWLSRGPWLVVLLLPLAALAFRRGWLLVVTLLVAGTLSAPPPAMASTWTDLWLRRDQQAAQALAQGDNARAAALATDRAQRGTAEYRAGHFKQALEAFSGASGTDADYNRGNALARLGRYKEALAAYEKALSAQPQMEDALHNKAVVEAMLRKQQERQQQGGGSQKDPPQGQGGSPQNQHHNPQAGDNPSRPAQQDTRAGNSGAREEAKDAVSKDGKKSPDSAAQSAQGSKAEVADAGTPASAGAAQEKRQDTAHTTRPTRQGGKKPRDKDKAGLAGARGSSGPNASEKSASGERSQTAAASQDHAAQAGAAKPPTAEGQAGEEKAESSTPGDPHESEEQQATEQWLRRIPDDPGGLLRRKFLYQYRQRAAAAGSGSDQNW
jgi:Ca-activated chloride channel family protein